uniref:Endonuclease/exonuclease/phosphatase domain-containing protein n=1 Tax=Noctiluca scintillans TaxID=2966 RepID=A0A7S1AJU7_NOCSC
MGNSATSEALDELRGVHGSGDLQQVLTEPLADDGPVDLAFMSFEEIPSHVEAFQSRQKHPLDQCVNMDSGKYMASGEESAMTGSTGMVQLLTGLNRIFATEDQQLATKYIGNLEAQVAWNSNVFEQDEDGELFGLIPEPTLIGSLLPNPKKSFVGRSFLLMGDLRICFVAAHFPMNDIRYALEDPENDPLGTSMQVLGRTLRSILATASERNIADERTIIFVQGDLNSRTVLEEGADGPVVADVLHSLLSSDEVQASITADLDMPEGRWYEAVDHPSALHLPVTYKFHEEIEEDCEFKMSSCSNFDKKGGLQQRFTIGDVLEAARGECPLEAEHSAPELSEGSSETGAKKPKPLDIYARTLMKVPPERLHNWGVAFKEKHAKPYHFPSSADRIIYWAPKALADRLTLTLPEGGYVVNHAQGGSDHRPVSLEVVLKVAAGFAFDAPREGAQNSVETNVSDENTTRDVNADHDTSAPLATDDHVCARASPSCGAAADPSGTPTDLNRGTSGPKGTEARDEGTTRDVNVDRVTSAPLARDEHVSASAIPSGGTAADPSGAHTDLSRGT